MDPADPAPDLERALYCARKVIEHTIDVYASSCSPNVLIYKGMLTAPQLRQYFSDLRDERLTSAIAVVHSRFSTNVLPRWDLAQPFRYIAHNGEINTVRGNRNWMTARETSLESDVLPLPIAELTPLVTTGMSDSASFDEVVELLVQAGRSLPHAVLMMIPEAWERSTFMSESRRDFYRYHAGLMEPWDGPASVTFCDGKVVGAVLDRNGLRPARYWVTKDQRVIFASEVGVLPVDPANIERKGRLQPGRVFLVDVEQGRIIDDEELKSTLAPSAPPTGSGCDEQQRSLDEIEAPTMLTPNHASIVRQQKNFGYSEEDLRLIIRHMAQVSEEPIGSMGSDSTVPTLSKLPAAALRLLHPTLRPGHEPAARRDSRGTGHLDARHDRWRGQPAHREREPLPPDRPAVADTQHRRTRQDPLHRRVRAHAGFTTVVIDGLFEAHGDGTGAERLASAIDRLCDEVVDEVRARHQHHHPLGPQHHAGARRHPESALGLGRAPPTRRRAPAHERGADHRGRRRARSAPRRAAARLRRLGGLSVPRL